MNKKQVIIRKKKQSRYDTELCDNSMTFQDCELAILRHAVDETEKKQSQKIANSEDVKRMISILEDFLKRTKCICYGGTAINNILPKFAQFYDREIEVPDYDFYSKTPLEHAKELADIYYKAGYGEVEAKSGVHHGTFKVFVNFIPIADITQLHSEIFDVMAKESIRVAGIYYAAPNFLRMNMFLELSRPAGDVSRWEKVLKRMTLLNQFYPISSNIECSTVEFQRKMSNNTEDSENIYYLVRNTLIDQGVVFFGGYAASLYSRYMPKHQQVLVKSIPDFDVISEDADTCAIIIVEQLEQAGYKKIQKISHPAIGELVPEHIEICVGLETVVFIYRPIACHNYNKIQLGNNEIKIATIDTMLTFYLAFYYTNQSYYYKDRIMCMIRFLFDVEQHNRLAQRGLLKRFSIDCYGKQPTLEFIRAEKMTKFKELKNNRNSREYEEWFLKYNPVATYGELIDKQDVKSDPIRGVSKQSVRNKKPLRRTKRKNSKKNGFLNIFTGNLMV
jgi:hypothetical protein